MAAAKPKKTEADTDTLEAAQALIDAQNAELDPALEDAQLDLANLVADLGGEEDAQVHVYRVKDNKKLAWINTFSPSEFDIGALLHSLRHEYGGGFFRVNVRQAGRIIKGKVIEVEPPSKTEIATRENPFATLDPVALIREMRQNDNAGEKLGTTELLLMMMKQQSETMTTIFQAMNNRPEPPAAPSMTELVASLAALKQLEPAQAKDNGLDMLLKGIELARDLNSGGESSGWDVLRSAVQSFGGTLAEAAKSIVPPSAPPRKVQQQQPKQLAKPAAPTIDHPIPEAGEFPKIETPNDPIRAQYKPYIDWMIAMAQADRDPEIYAHVVIDQLGPDLAYSLLADQNGLDQALKLFPEIAPVLPWFIELGGAIDQLTNDDAGGDDAPIDETDALPDVHAPSTEADADDVDGLTERTGRDSENAATNGGVG